MHGPRSTHQQSHRRTPTLIDDPAPRAFLSTGLFAIVVAGSENQLRLSAHLFGSNLYGQGDAGGVLGQGEFSSVLGGDTWNCGLTVQGRLFCSGALDIVPAAFTTQWKRFSVSVGPDATMACGVDFGHELVCVGEMILPTNISLLAPTGWMDVRVDSRWGCALTMLNELVCWNVRYRYFDMSTRIFDPAQLIPSRFPAELRYSAVSVGSSIICAVTTDGTLLCDSQRAPPSTQGKRFTAVSVSPSDSALCGVLVSKRLLCYSETAVLGAFPFDASSTLFKDVRLVSASACGLQTNLSVVCWPLFQMTPIGSSLISVPVLAARVGNLAPVGTFGSQACVNNSYSMSEGAGTAACSGWCAAGRYGGSAPSRDDQCFAACPSGSWCAVASTSPSLCLAGSFGARSGSVGPTCDGLCSPGYWCTNGSTSGIQHPCFEGHYGHSAGATAGDCDGLCSGGFFCPAASISSTTVACGSASVFCAPGSGAPTPVQPGFAAMCPPASVHGETHCFNETACSVGSYCLAGIVRLCGAGSFAASEGQSSCDRCIAGSFSAVSNATTCHLCDRGSYAPNPGSTSCLLCSPGHSQNQTGQTDCDLCSAGTYAEPGSSLCEPCESGQVSLDGSAFCSVCPGGFEVLPPAVTCSPCGPGRFSLAGDSSCSDCSPGRYNLGSASASCELCHPGTMTALYGSINCTDCAPGTWRQNAGSADCQPCGAGTYQDVPGSQTQCKACSTHVSLDHTSCFSGSCSANHQYSTAASSCVVCQLGWASDAGVGQVCKVCVAGFYTPSLGDDCMSCDQPGLRCSNGLARVESGYYAYRRNVNVGNHTMSLFRTAPCPASLCLGAELQTAGTLLVGNLTVDTALSGAQCQWPHLESPLCGQCAEGYTPWASDCEQCESNGRVLVACVAVSLGLVLFLLRTSSSSAGFLDVFLYFVQSAMLIVGPLSNWLSWLSFVNFSPHSSPRCITPLTPHQQVLLSVTMPLILLSELVVVAVVHALLSAMCRLLRSLQCGCGPASIRRRAASMLESGGSFEVQSYISAVFAILLFSYTEVATACIQFIHCISVADDRVVFAMPAIQCSGTDYTLLRLLVFLMLGVYILGFPLATVAFLRKRSGNVREAIMLASRRQAAQQANDSAGEGAVAPLRPEDDSSPTSFFLASFGPLFVSYRGAAWFWSSCMLARRVAFVLVSSLIVADPAERFMSFAFLNFYSLVVHMWVQPFATTELNHADTIAHALLVTLSVMLTANLPPYNAVIQMVIVLLIVPASAIMAALVFRELRPKLKQGIALLQRLTTAAKRKVGHMDAGRAVPAGPSESTRPKPVDSIKASDSIAVELCAPASHMALHRVLHALSPTPQSGCSPGSEGPSPAHYTIKRAE